MLDSELKQSKFPLIWDATLLSMIWSCPRAFYWFMRRVDYAGEAKPPYFTWGASFQEILSAWYSLPEEQRLDNVEQAKEIALDAGLQMWDKEGIDKPPSDTRDGLIRIFSDYIEFYPTEPWHIVKGGAELGWMYPLRETPYYLAGSLDGYVNWPGYGILILENKTSGRYLSDNYISQWAFSPQITNYIWYLTQLRQKEAFGCLVNMICKIVPGAKANWSTPRFTRSLETRSKVALQEFENQVLYTIQQAEDFWNDWYFPKTLNHVNCAGGPGTAPCKMKRICLLDEPFTELDPPAMYSYLKYRDTEWKPWERKGEQTNE